MTDIIQKWLVGVLTTLSVALVISALSLWQRVAAVEAWRTETMPLQMAVERAQIATTLNAVELQAVRAEMRVEELADDVRSLDERVRDLENGND